MPVDITPFSEQLTTEKTVLFEYSGMHVLSPLRDKSTVSGTGAIAFSQGEIALSTGTTANSVSSISTTEMVRYGIGYITEASMAVRTSISPLSGNQIARWGVFDATNGMGFGVNATSVFVFSRSASTDTVILQANWNVDKLDGTGTSGLTLDLVKGATFHIRYSTHGVIEFSVSLPSTTVLTSVVVHRIVPSSNPIFTTPNLPITMTSLNASTTSNFILYVAGRRAIVHGTTRFAKRQGSFTSLIPELSSGWKLLHSVRKKSAANDLNIPIYWLGMDYTQIISTPFYWRLVQGGTLTGASFSNIGSISANESALEGDSSATAITGGTTIAFGFSPPPLYRHLYPIPMVGTDIYSISIQRINNNAPLTGLFSSRWEEQW